MRSARRRETTALTFDLSLARRLNPEERRKQIIEAAIELFSEHGFEGTTRELARRLKITQPLLYRYFASKDELLAEVYDTVYVRTYRAEWEALVADQSIPLRERLVTFYKAYTQVVYGRKWMRLYLFSGLRGLPFNKWWASLVEKKIVAEIARALRREFGDGIDGPFRDADIELAWTLHGAVFYFGVRRKIYGIPARISVHRHIENSVDAFLFGARAVLASRRALEDGSVRTDMTGME